MIAEWLGDERMHKEQVLGEGALREGEGGEYSTLRAAVSRQKVNSTGEGEFLC